MEPLTGLIINSAILLAAAAVFYLVFRPAARHALANRLAAGAFLGIIGCALMLNPWVLAPGIIFDTRSVLLSVAGLYFGALPTLIAMAATGALRMYQGGAGALTGVIVIIATGAIGVLWGRFRPRSSPPAWRELYVFGVLVHVVMLICLLTLPDPLPILSQVGLPVILIFPIATVIMGMLLSEHLRRESIREALGARETELSLVTENMPALLARLDTELRFRFVNRHVTRLAGMRKESILGKPIRAFLDQDTLDRCQPWIERAMAGEQVHFEQTLRARDGRIAELNLTLLPERGAGGELAGLLCIGLDITERMRNERERRKLAEEVQRYVEASPTALYAILPNECSGFRPYWVGENIERLTGYTRQEVLEPGWWESRLHPEDRELAAASGVWLANADQFQHEYRILRRDGSVLWVLDEMRAIGGKNGAPVQVIGSWTDITAIKAAEAELRERELRFRRMFLRHHAVMLLIEPDSGAIVDANAAAERFYGYDADTLRAMYIQQINMLPPEEVAAERARAKREERDFFVFPHRLANGETRTVEVHSSPIDTPQGRLLFSVIHDITERKRLEEQVLHAQKMESVGRLAGGVAHDFNNMLNVINGYADSLIEALAPDDPMRGDLQEIRNAGERAATLTRQLLAFSRKQVLRPRVLNVRDIVLGLDKLLRRLIGEHIALRLELDPDTGNVRADPAQLEQVIMNLAVNARDAMPDGGVLRIETRNETVPEEARILDSPLPEQPVPAGDYVVLTVADTGAGIQQEIQARVFEPFFTTKPMGQGTGLGLATIHGIVEQSGGRIFLHSAPGQGARFDIYLPLADAPPEPARQQALLKLARGHERVLLVEDEEKLRILAERILARAGYTVESAANGLEALQLFENASEPHDLLLTDVVMPGMNGGALAARLRDQRPDLPVLFMSGYPDNAINAELCPDARTDFVGKPFSAGELTGKIRALLASQDGAPRATRQDG